MPASRQCFRIRSGISCERSELCTDVIHRVRSAFFVIAVCTLFLGSVAKADFQTGLDYYFGKDYEAALLEWQKTAERDPAARHAVGTLYLNGLGVERDVDRAFNLIKSAAEDGYVPAIGLLGLLYREGIGTEINLTESIKFLTIAADDGDTAAIYDLAVSYLNGIGVEVDERHARKLIESIAEKGDPSAIELYAWAFLAPGIGGAADVEKALSLLLNQAENGSIEAAYRLGEIYSDSQYGVHDLAAAKQWFGVAADAGDSWAQLDLGNLIIANAKGPDDFDEGIRRLEQAANAPDDPGIIQWVHYHLAEAYLGKSHEAADIKAAITHFEKAIEAGSGFAANKLGDLYIYGDLVPGDPVRALHYYQKAIELGVETSHFNIGWIYFYHQLEDPNHIDKAIEHWTRGAAADDPFSIEWLGSIYLDGNGVEQNYSTAATYLDRAVEFWRHYPGFKTREEYPITSYLRVLRLLVIAKINQGNYQEIESQIAEAFDLFKSVPETDDSRSQILAFATALSSAYAFTGRFEAAHEVLNSAREVLGSMNPFESRYLDVARVFVYEAEGRFVEIGPYIDAAINSLKSESLEDAEYFTGADFQSELMYLTSIRVRALVAEGRIAEARRIYTESLRDHDELIVPMPTQLRIRLADAYLTLSEGKVDDAFQKFVDLIERTERFGLRQHGLVLVELGSIAAAFESHGSYVEAIEFARRAVEIYSESAEGTGPYRKRVARKALETYIRILWKLIESNTSTHDKLALVDEAFKTSQLLGNVRLASVLEMTAMRFAGGNAELAELLSRKYRLTQAITQVGAPINAMALIQSNTGNSPIGGPLSFAERGQERNGQQPIIEMSSDRLVKLSSELRDIDLEIQRKFPDYTRIANPIPVSIAEVQAILDAKEALIVFLVSDENVYVWGISSSAVHFAVSSMTANELSKTVQEVRDTLDQGDVVRLADLEPFSIAGAHLLYEALITPVAETLNGVDKILVVPDGPLWSIPLEALVQDENGVQLQERIEATNALQSREEYELYRNINWFGSNIAFSYLPAVRSLVSLRNMMRPSLGSRAFVGFGAPNFTGAPGSRGSGSVSSFQAEDGRVDLSAIKNLPALPETELELLTISEALGGSKSDLFFGSRATETIVRQSALNDARVVAFATHALVGGELQGLQEPAMVLSPPEVASEVDDGLLTASEISQLHLDADIVILSACNTAAPDNSPIADGMSGLAESFFLAGARRMLVTHWSVFSNSAVEITTTLTENVAGEAPMTYSAALAAAIIAVREDPDHYYFSHPAFWAPYVVVGVD